jgi:hypothetical protein
LIRAQPADAAMEDPQGHAQGGEQPTHASLHADVEEFLGKWRSRWPEWRIAQVFIDPAQRVRAEAWFALLQEFTDAAWSHGDPTPGIAKLGWWQEELRGWSKGARRHPLGIVLHRFPAPWASLAAGIVMLPSARERVHAADATALQVLTDHLRPYAEAIDACERILFAGASAGDAVAHEGADPRAAVVYIALQTLWLSADATGVAHYGEQARTARAAWPGPASTRPRRVYDALIHRRLRTTAAGGALLPLSPWATLWAAWGAARR